MRVCFLRHTTAVDIAPRDALRALTPAGEKEAQLAGAGLAALGIGPTDILSSPLLRTRQTAEIVARTMKFTGGITPLNELANDHSTAELLWALEPYRMADTILLVGHMPSLAEHITELIAAPFLDGFGKGSAALVELPVLRRGAGQLVWRKCLEELLTEP